MTDSTKLLVAYKLLWSSRSLASEGKSEEEQLIEAIRVELKDELTHPRLRKDPKAKYFLAIKRITTSTLTDREQISLIKQFNVVLEQILGEKKEVNL
ncbi:hypothetical protein [Sutcliffiella deserti]|uniref:hypothetical protein n=1 Tax=Sutcliffiella deserti TaxID=2875501 RepID=UPI001CBEFF21|nr:hypothetical protein [Sutcliffiella deserti]